MINFVWKKVCKYFMCSQTTIFKLYVSRRHAKHFIQSHNIKSAPKGALKCNFQPFLITADRETNGQDQQTDGHGDS